MMAVLGVYVICWGLRGFLLFFLSACICLVPVKTSVLSQQIPGAKPLKCFAFFVCLWSLDFFPCQKLLRWLGTISLKSTVAKHKLLLEVFVKLYLLKYIVKFLLFETCDN